jgi:RNA polymerase sigma factor (sigma-70 family)
VDAGLTDIELWDNLKKGNRIALNTIYSKYFSPLYQYGMRMLQDEDAVYDCIQNLFVRIWTNHHKLNNVDNLRSYLITSLRNGIINYKSSENRFQKVDLESNEVFDLKFNLESAYIKREEETEKGKQLADAMNQLTGRQKEIIYLRYFEEMEYAEISEIMQLSMKGTYKLSARALEALREVMKIDKSLLLAILLAVKA